MRFGLAAVKIAGYQVFSIFQEPTRRFLLSARVLMFDLNPVLTASISKQLVHIIMQAQLTAFEAENIHNRCAVQESLLLFGSPSRQQRQPRQQEQLI